MQQCPQTARSLQILEGFQQEHQLILYHLQQHT